MQEPHSLEKDKVGKSPDHVDEPLDVFPEPFRQVAEYFMITFKSKSPVFVPRWLASDIMSHYHFVTLEDTGEIYVYNPCSGIYELSGNPLIRTLVSINLGDLHRKSYAEEVVYEILYWFPFYFEDDWPGIIGTLNGFLAVYPIFLGCFPAKSSNIRKQR